MESLQNFFIYQNFLYQVLQYKCWSQYWLHTYSYLCWKLLSHFIKCNHTPKLVLFWGRQIPNLRNENWRIYGVSNLPNDWTACLRQLLSTTTVIHSQSCQFPMLNTVKPFLLCLGMLIVNKLWKPHFHVSPAFRDPSMQRVAISRDRSRQKNAWEQPQGIT